MLNLDPPRSRCFYLTGASPVPRTSLRDFSIKIVVTVTLQPQQTENASQKPQNQPKQCLRSRGFKYGTSCWTTYFNTGCSSIDFNRGSTMYARISETNSCINSNLGVNGELNLNGTNNFKFGASNWTMCYYPTCNSIDFNYSGTYSMRLTQNNLNVACMSTNTITIGTCLTMNGELNLAGTNNFKFGTSTWCMKYNSSYASIDFNYGGSTKARLYSTGNLAVVGIFQEVTSLLA